MGRVSVPLWLVVLSDQLPVKALVSRYLTNKLIGRRTLLDRKSFTLSGLSGISHAFRRVIPESKAGSNVLRTRSPLLSRYL